MDYKIVSLAERFDLFEAQDSICGEVWPEFMLHDTVANSLWMRFIESFKELQLLMMDEDEVLAVINTVPIRYDGPVSDLPDEGWDWGVRKSVTDLEAGIEPNVLMGVQIVVNKAHHGKGLSYPAVKEMVSLAARKGFNGLILPVRPSEKHRYPLVPMEEYMQWENEKDLPFDSWLRVHVKSGGEIVKACQKSMYISGSIDEWKNWTGMEFPGSGQYIVPGALNPVSIDLENDRGIYIEPNVWTVHRTGGVI
jgi:hypothetical protein